MTSSNNKDQTNSVVRLNKYLALQLGISRREADDLISAGRISINGEIASLGARFTDGADITLDHKLIDKTPKTYQYLLLNKPVGYVCSRKAQGPTPTIYSLLPTKYRQLKPVGRLDADSSGLILLTNDGDFAYRMTHPKFHKIKIYKVELDKDLAPLHQQMIADFGIDLPDGKSQLGLERLSDDNRLEWRITMNEGRNRQIRRTFASLGYTVVKLHRTNFGSYDLESLKTKPFKEIECA